MNNTHNNTDNNSSGSGNSIEIQGSKVKVEEEDCDELKISPNNGINLRFKVDTINLLFRKW